MNSGNPLEKQGKMFNFQDRLVQHLASQLGVPEQKVRGVTDSFGIPVAKKEGKVVGRDSLVQHKCERPPRGKTSPCGKPAANEITLSDGSVHWYCGTTNKGCIKSMLAELDKEEKTKAAQAIAEETETMKKRSKKQRKKKKNPEKEIIEILDKHKTVPKTKHLFKKTDTAHGPLWIHSETKIVAHQGHYSSRKGDTFAEAYGVLTKDHSIRPLNTKDKEWLEMQRIRISEDAITEVIPPPKPQESSDESSGEPEPKKVSKKKVSSDESSEEPEPKKKVSSDESSEEPEVVETTKKKVPSDESDDEPEEEVEFDLADW